MTEVSPRECPKCGAEAHREETEIGIMLTCPECGFEAGDPLRLDFKSD